MKHYPSNGSSSGSCLLDFHQSFQEVLTQEYSLRPSCPSSTTHPVLAPLTILNMRIHNFTMTQRSKSESKVDKQVIKAAKNVVVEQLHPNVEVRSSHLSCHGNGHISSYQIGDNKCPFFGNGTHNEEYGHHPQLSSLDKQEPQD